MNDSFSLLAKSIRQNKINKEELLNNLKKIQEAESQREDYIKMVITIQKCIRGFLFRKKYRLLLDEINIKTVIDYLYEKKKKRIHEHSEEIISFFVSKYINKNKRKKNNIFSRQYKIHCVNLIKARLKGIVTRKKINKKLETIRKAKNLIFKHILSLRTILILKSSAIQNLLCDIAKIKYQLKNCQNEKCKELRNKLHKNINLFYDTYFYAKNNCNWGNETRENFFEEKWHQKFFDIINANNKNDEKNKNGGNEQLYFNEKNNMVNNNNFFNSGKIFRYQNLNSLKIVPKNLSESLKFKNNVNSENNEFIAEFKIEEKENFSYQNKNKRYRYSLNDINNGINTRRENSKFVSDKNIKKRISDVDLNNINNKLFYSTKKINGFVPNEEIIPKSMNAYFQMEEREIKPLKTKDILNCKNPFGIRNTAYKKSNTFKEIKGILNSEKDNLFNKRNSANLINRDEKPIGGNKINYDELFGEDGELKFEGDPFGGAKQFETKKDMEKINNISKSSKIKKPVYDARKAIEEAKLKEEKNKEKNNKDTHNKFREFLKEMKKNNCNNNDAENKNKKKENLNINKRYCENIRYEVKEKINGINICESKNVNDYLDNKNGENKNVIGDNKTKVTVKREKSLNKSTNQILRKKLHDLEQNHAPAVNRKSVRSKINCWFNKENQKDSRNNKNKFENYYDKKLLELNIEINKVNNSFNLNNYFEQKEEKMKKFKNVPFIRKDDKYVNLVKTIDVKEYENMLEDICKEYKILK